MRLTGSFLLATTIALASCAADPPPPSIAPPPPPAPSAPPAPTPPPPPQVAMNPFFQPSSLQYQAPPFDRIHDGDYEPAIEEGMKAQMAEVLAIADQAEAPSFENTVVAMERSGRLLERAANVFFAMTHANTNDTLQKIEETVAPKLAASSSSTVRCCIPTTTHGRSSSNSARV